MSWVRKPDRFSSDAIIAGRVSDPDGFVTEHREIEGLTGPIKLFFSVTGLRHLASKYPQVGLVPATEVALRDKEIADLKDQLASTEEELVAAVARNERIAGLVSDGFKVQKVQGRPKKETEV